MYEHEEAIGRIRRHLRSILLARQIFPLLTISCFAWGTAILMLRVVWGWSPMLLLWGGLALPVAVIVGMMLAVRRIPGAHEIRALLDKTSHCGGLLLTSEEREIGAWQTQLPPVTALRCRWSWKRPVLQFLLGAAFVVAGLLLPLQSPLIASNRALQVGKEVKQLTEQIDVLKKEEALDTERAKELETELEEIVEKATAKKPEKTFDALDHLEDLVKKTGNKSGEEALTRTEEMAKAQSLAEALRQAGESLDAEMKAEAMAELSKLVQKLASENANVRNRLDAETMKALQKNGQVLSSEQMRRIAEALEGAQSDISSRLQNLQQAQLIDAEMLRRHAELGACCGKELGELMKCECNGSGRRGEGEGRRGRMTVAEMMRLAQGKPGQGGITRGRADAPLTYGEETTEQGVKFKEHVLPQGKLKSLKDSYQYAESWGIPVNESKGIRTVRGGAVQGTATGKSSAVQQQVLPVHRSAVQRYFDRMQEQAVAPKTESK